jgi:crossover junction endodeoxyribonuclease RuvC
MPSPPQAIVRKLRVLGVDPALAGPTGYGIVEVEGTVARLVRYGALRLPRHSGLGARLREIHALIESLVQEFSPDAVAVESVFTALNVRTAIQLAEVRGVVLLAAAQANVPSHSYSPREVKACVAGYGAASKDQVQQMVSATLGLRERPEPADASDALAIALCHAFLSRSRDRLAAATAQVSPAPLVGGAFKIHRTSGRAVRIQELQ